MQQDFAFPIDEQHRDVVVALDDAQQKVHVGLHGHGIAVLIDLLGGCGSQLLGGVGPYLHAVALHHGKVLDQAV